MEEFNTKRIRKEIKDFEAGISVKIELITDGITKEQHLEIEKALDLCWENVKNTVLIK